MTSGEVLQGWFDGLWNQGDQSTIDRLAASGILAHGLGPADVVGREPFRQFYRSFRAAFPAVTVSFDDLVEAGDRATGLLSVDLTAADGSGPFRISGSCTVRVVNDQIVEGWNYFDFLSLATQMGAVPADALERAMMMAVGGRP